MATASIEQTLSTTRALIDHLQETLKTDTSSESAAKDKAINPLALSSTAASLIKAQTTKLTLLALNKPYTPSSIVQILNTISTSPLPALVTAVQICDPAKFGAFAQHELKNKTLRLLRAYRTLLAEIPTTQDAQAGRKSESPAGLVAGPDEMNQKAALVGTGLVWEVCDELVVFSEQGLGAMAANKLASYRGLFNDALEEIDEWLEDGKDDGGVEDRLENLDLESNSSDSASLESFSSRPIQETVIVADWTLNILNHVTLLFPPLTKRRIRKFPVFNGKTSLEALSSIDVARLDQILDMGKFWSEQIDAIAESLFENDVEAAITKVEKLIDVTESITNLTRATWDGSEDELSAWLSQWAKKFTQVKMEGRPPH